MMVQGLERANVGTYRLLGKRRKEERKKMKEKNQPKGKEAGMLRATGEEQREGGIWKVLSPFAREVKTPEITLSKSTWIFGFWKKKF